MKSMFVLSKHISIKRSRCVRAENDQHGHPTPSEPRDTRIRNPVILVILEFPVQNRDLGYFKEINCYNNYEHGY